MDANLSDAVQVRAGKFKIPFGLEALTGISNLDFVYRSLSARYLAPSRDIGVAVHGRFFDRGLNYWAGWFRQDGDNARSSHDRRRRRNGRRPCDGNAVSLGRRV